MNKIIFASNLSGMNHILAMKLQLGACMQYRSLRRNITTEEDGHTISFSIPGIYDKAFAKVWKQEWQSMKEYCDDETYHPAVKHLLHFINDKFTLKDIKYWDEIACKIDFHEEWTTLIIEENIENALSSQETIEETEEEYDEEDNKEENKEDGPRGPDTP